VGLPDPGSGRRSSRGRLYDGALGASALGARLAGSMGLADRNDAALRADHFSVVSRLGYPISIHAKHAAAGGLDRELTRGLLAASHLGDNGDGVRLRSMRSGLDDGAIDGSASRDQLLRLERPSTSLSTAR
jgi:hypothetical protein